MFLKRLGNIAAHRLHLESLFSGIINQRLDQFSGNPSAAKFGRHQRMFSSADFAVLNPGEAADLVTARDMGVVFTGLAIMNLVPGYRQTFHALFLDLCRFIGNRDMVMHFTSDNAARVHPAVWAAMQAADAPDAPYDGDVLSQRLDEAFSGLFGQSCVALWAATGTAANCLALSPMVPPHGGVVCHREAHIEMDEAGAPGFYLHGAKLMLADGDGAMITPEGIAAVIDPIRDDVHQVQPHAISITQASEYGRAYRPDEVAAIGALAKARGLKLHMDGARFANAVAHLGCSADAVSCSAGVDVLCFGFVKNGGMGAEAIVFFDENLADTVHYRRKRAGHLQSKGRFLAAQIHAMLTGDLWLANARAANGAAQEIAGASNERLLHPVEANELFVTTTSAEREALRSQGFTFYDWGDGAARFVTSWCSQTEHVGALSRAIAAL